jgi:hypothetical protein
MPNQFRSSPRRGRVPARVFCLRIAVPDVFLPALISSLFDWLDFHPWFYWLLAIPATVLLLVHVARLTWQESGASPAARSTSPRWDAPLLFLFLIAWRWPFLLCAAEYNPDESQFIAGAITLTHDPVFWRSVDGTTSGPLNFYVLLPLHWIGMPLDYFTARVVGLLLIFGTLFATLRTLGAIAPRGVAWLAVLPAAGLYGTMFIPDFIHYSSEHLPLCLIACSCWLLTVRPVGDRMRLFLATFIAGSAPWAKLQAGPIIAVIVAAALWQVWSERQEGSLGPTWQRWLGVAVAAFAPTAIVMSLAAMFGVTHTVVERYILQNLFYVEEGRSVSEALSMMWTFAVRDWRMPLFLVTTVPLVAVLALLAAWLRARPAPVAVVGFGLLVTSVIAIVTPHREYLHYALFLVVPLALLLGSLGGACWNALRTDRGRLALAALMLVSAGLPPFVTRLFQPTPEMFGEFLEHWRRPRTPTGEILHRTVGGRGSLAVWGWVQSLFVEADMPQGTRDPISFRSMLPGPLQEYFRRDFIADFRRNRPAAFVDVSGPEAFMFTNRAEHGHETFPELASAVRENYTLIRDTGAGRIYVRNDLMDPQWTPDALDALATRARDHDGVAAPETSDTPLDWRTVDSRRILMLLPPARMEWPLSDNTRQVSLIYGVEPTAYVKGHTNGVTLVVELREGQNLRQVFRRHLDPVNRQQHRGRQTALVTLPPFSPGARLVLRSEPGEHGDTAWDWLYVSRLSPREHRNLLPQQFPGFSRAPSAAYAPRSVLLEAGRERWMDVNPPASFTFKLDGGESRVRFDYGLLSSAYEGENRTDGATFRIEIRRGDASSVVFERHLNPLEVEADRGVHAANVALPPLKPGDELTVTLGAGPNGNDAWDWTVFRNLVIE